MPNYKPTQNENVKSKQFKALGLPEGEVLGKRNFSIKLPIDVEETLLGMEQAQRVTFLRNLIVDAVRGSCRSDKIETPIETSGVFRWNVYESAETYDREAGKMAWGEWELVGSHKKEDEAKRQIKMRKDHLHYKNSQNDYGIVQLRWEQRHELMLPAQT